MKKTKFKVFSLVLVCMMFLSTVALASNQEIEIQGKIIDGRFLVPMRSIFENLGVTDIVWNGKNKTITANKDNFSMLLTIGTNKSKINNNIVVLDVPPVIINGNTYVPARFIGESLGAEVIWSGEEQTAYIYKDNISIKVTKESVHIVDEGYFEDSEYGYYGVLFSDGVFISLNIDPFYATGGASTVSYILSINTGGKKVSKDITVLGSNYFDDYTPLSKFEFISNYSSNTNREFLINSHFFEKIKSWNGIDPLTGIVHFKAIPAIDSIYFNDGVHECELYFGI